MPSQLDLFAPKPPVLDDEPHEGPCCGDCNFWMLSLPGHIGHHSCKLGKVDAHPGGHCSDWVYWIGGKKP